jgi:N-acetylglutamate synthase
LESISTPGSVRIGAQNVGSRVVVRYRLAPDEHGSDGESLTDVLGELVSFSDVSVVVRRKNGESAKIATSLVVAAKVIPPAPGPRRSAAAADTSEATGPADS